MRKNTMNRDLFGRNLRRVARHGRLPKAPEGEGEGGGGTPAGGDNNGGGNSGGNGSESQGGNNNGQDFDPATFWTGPAPTPTPAPSGESAGNNSGEPGTGGDLQTTLTQQLEAITGGTFMTAEIAQQINEGNFEGIQKAFDSGIQTAVRQALSMNVQIMRPLADQILAQVREEFGGVLNQRDNNDALLKDFPTAANPQVRPIIEGIFNQALKNTKGDRATAVKQTKEMIRLTASLSAGDLGVTVAPRSADDGGAPAISNFNWLDELTSR